MGELCIRRNIVQVQTYFNEHFLEWDVTCKCSGYVGGKVGIFVDGEGCKTMPEVDLQICWPPLDNDCPLKKVILRNPFTAYLMICSCHVLI